MRAARCSALLLVLLWVTGGLGAEPDPRERLIRGALVYKFAKFVTWPERAFTPGAQLVIGVFGDPDLAALIAERVEGLEVAGRPVVGRAVDQLEDIPRCHVIFLAATTPEQLGPLLERAATAPVLTVGSQPDFLTLGGMINLVNQDGRIQFAVNVAASSRADLRLDSRLLQTAIEVVEAP